MGKTTPCNSAIARLGAALVLLSAALGFAAQSAASDNSDQQRFEESMALYDNANKSRDPNHPDFAAAIAIWRPLAASQDALASDGLKFLKKLLG